jgi:O-antigen ligase
LSTSPGRIFWLFESGYHNDVLGPFVNHDHYAAFIELLLPIALYEALTDRRRAMFGAAAAASMLASVVAGASRAGTVLVVAESALVLFLASRRGLPGGRKAFLYLSAFALVFTAIVGVTHLWQRLQDPDPFRGRRLMLISALAMTQARPLTGFGLGNFENAYPAYAAFDDGVVVDHAHNDWVEWAAEGGLIFTCCLLLMVISAIRPAFRTIWGIGVISVFLHSLVDYPMQKPALALWVFVLLGVVIGSNKRCELHHRFRWSNGENREQQVQTILNSTIDNDCASQAHSR